MSWRIRPVSQPVLCNGITQRITNRTGFHGGHAVFDVDIQDAVEIARSINNQPRTDGIARNRGAATARDDRPATLLRDFDAIADIVDRLWLNDSLWNASENRRIRRIRSARGHVFAHARTRHLLEH